MRELFFNERGVGDLAASIKKAWPAFDPDTFVRSIVPRFPDLGLNERNYLIRDTLKAQLPPDYPRAVSILVKSLEPRQADENFAVMSLCAFVAEYGRDHVAVSLAALREMTKRFSAEFAIRPFLDRDPAGVLAELETWALDPDPRVRRLASEGTRPRLPWGMRLQKFVKDPRPVLKILEILKEDAELFVRRSVANNLNDIAKDHGDLVVATLRRWKKSPKPETQWLVKHALRTLLKQGHPEALGLLGYAHGASVILSGLKVSKKSVTVGETQSFTFTLTSTSKTPQRLMIDYAIHYRKSNGEQKPKVFKLKSSTINHREPLTISKNHPFRPIGIRPFYPGKHDIEILVNGKSLGRTSFALRMT